MTEENGSGAAISAQLYASDSLLIDTFITTDGQGNFFKRCGSSSGRDGAIYVNAESGAYLAVKSSTFEECWCVNTTKPLHI